MTFLKFCRKRKPTDSLNIDKLCDTIVHDNEFPHVTTWEELLAWLKHIDSNVVNIMVAKKLWDEFQLHESR